MIRTGTWLGALLLLCGIAVAGEPLFVSPSGTPGAAGTREAPLATVAEALQRLPAEGGVIRLRGGLYRESVRIAGSGGPVRIEAEPGEEVNVDGGISLSQWQPWPEAEGLFVAAAKEVRAMWDLVRRVRYLHQMDAEGVRAWPGSFVMLEDGRVLVHPARGAAPEELRADSLETGFEITRDQTTLQGLRFSSFLGVPGATAVRIGGNATGVVVENCRMENMVRGIVIERGARETRVARCVIRDVATGIQFGGVGLEAEQCVILAAVGDYAIRGEAEYDWSNGIRFYHPAEKATIRHCLTAGFWAGLYHKTTPGRDGAKPFRCEGNVFLDNIKTGTAGQAESLYRDNLVAGGISAFKRLEGVGAKVEGNYFFNPGTKRQGTDAGGNRWGGDPFRDLAGGNFEPVAGDLLPEGVLATLKQAIPAGVSWTADLAAHYREAGSGPLRWAKPVVAASSQGALVTIPLTAPAKGVLRYRPVTGGGQWRRVASTSAGLSSDESLAGLEWPEDAPEGETPRLGHRLAFALAGGVIREGTEYEAEVEIDGAERQPGPIRFVTRGAPRTLQTGPGLEYPTLQAALDHALPGDTVALAAAVFVEPALLLHGGTAEHPLVIEGEGAQKTILDGGKKCAAFLELRGAPHVTIRGVQVRHFDRAGIVVQESPFFTVEHSFFRNKRNGRSITQGTGVLLKSSPRSRVVYNTFVRLLYGMQAVDSPQVTLEHNTAFNNVFSSALLRDSASGSVVRYNSFTFTGNVSFYIREKDPTAFQSLVCDFNNYGTQIRKIGEVASRAYAEAGVTPGEQEAGFPVPERYGALSGSKRIIDYVHGGEGKDPRERFFSMEAWRKFSGKDAHSIYADPAYVDPSGGDFRLLPESPNRLPDGRVIGSSPLSDTQAHANL